MHLLRTILYSTIALAIGSGCASVSSRSMSFLPEPGRNAKADQDKKVAAAEDTALANQSVAPEKSTPETGPNPGTAQHDSATQLLIATELRDAPASERQAWMAYINTLPAAEVPKALRERRLGAEPGMPRTIELEQQAEAMAQQRATPSSDVASSTIQQTSGESPVVTPRPSAAQHSLSNVEAADNAPEHTQVVQTRHDSDAEATAPEHGSLFPTWPDWDKSKFWHPPESAQKLKDRLPLPKIIAGGDRPAEVVEQPDVAEPQTVSALPSRELLDRPIPQPELRISPGATLWEDEIRKLIALLEADAALVDGDGSTEQKRYVRQQVALRMLYLIAEDPQKAQRVIPQLPPSDQEFWTNVFLGLSTYLNDSDIDPMERRTQAIAQLRTAVHHLQESARLQIRNLNFCHRIDGFGNYERFPQDVFAPGDAVLLYCELRNFHSEPLPDGHYESKMRSSIQFVRQGDSLVADQSEFETTRDLSRTVRTDYFHAHRLDLPQLAPGAYILKLRVEDELSGKIATESIPLTIR